MNDADRLQLTRLFVAALQSEVTGGRTSGLDETSIPFDSGAFAQAIQKLTDANNALARLFPVFTTISGTLCPDFQHGMAVAQSAGFISRLNPSFQRFTVNLSHRQVLTLARDERFADARTLAQEYLSLTLGSPGVDAGERDSAVA